MISIIIPVYNPEPKMIIECLHSITKQKADFEVLLIDDGSTKDISDLCDKICTEDERVSVIHKSNEGVSAARNKGIELSKGEWIMFVDADDWIEDKSLDKLSRICDESEADLIFSGHRRNYPTKEIIIRCQTYSNNQIISSEKEKVDLLKKTIAASEYGEPGAKATCYRAVWSALFRKSCLINNNIRFPVGVPIGEDLIFRLYSENAANKIQYLDLCYYHYRNNSNSASVKYRSEAINDSLKELKHIRQFIEQSEYMNELTEAYKFRVVEVMTVLPNRCFFHKDNPKNIKQRNKDANIFYHSNIIRKNVTSIIVKKLPLKRRVQVFLLKHGLYRVYMTIINVSKIGV